MKKMMYMNLVKHTDKVLYLTHSNPQENKWGYVIHQRCFKENKDFIEVVDRISTEEHNLSTQAKDLGSGQH